MLTQIRHTFTVLIGSRAWRLPHADAFVSGFTVLIERTLALPQVASMWMSLRH